MKMNRYERMKRHKFTVQKRRANMWYFGGGDDASWTQLKILRPDIEYWKQYDYSKRRKSAKAQTESLLHAKFRSGVLVRDADDDISVGRSKSYYKKIYDYWWVVL